MKTYNTKKNTTKNRFHHKGKKKNENEPTYVTRAAFYAYDTIKLTNDTSVFIRAVSAPYVHLDYIRIHYISSYGKQNKTTTNDSPQNSSTSSSTNGGRFII